MAQDPGSEADIALDTCEWHLQIAIHFTHILQYMYVGDVTSASFVSFCSETQILPKEETQAGTSHVQNKAPLLLQPALLNCADTRKASAI